jgi:hypothetical protein
VPPPLGAPRTPPLTAPPPGSPGAPRAPPAGPSSVLAAEQSRKVPPAAACRLVSRDRAAPPEDVAVETEAVVEGRSGKEGLGLSGERVRCGSITIWCRGGAAAGGGAFGSRAAGCSGESRFMRANWSIRDFLNFVQDVRNDIYFEPEGVFHIKLCLYTWVICSCVLRLFII